MATATELPIDSTATALDMANEIFGGGATVNSATYSGDPLSSGIYTDGDTVSPGVTPGDTGVILSTGHVDDFTNSDGSTNTNQATNTSTNTTGVNGDAQFNALAGAPTFDASILEVDFTPSGDFLTVDFVIASEEYPEFINSNFLDVVGVWVNGVEATVSIGNGNASVGNINGASTPNLYNDNTGDAFNTEADGFTITLTFVAPVNPGVPNTLRVGVADVTDSNFDTNLLIAGGSVQSTIVAQDDEITLGNNDTNTLDVLDNDSSTGGTLTVTHINGTAVVAGDTVSLGTGQDITLNADGTFEIAGDSDDETVYFTYTIEDTNGNTDDGLVEVTQVPCFAAGTRIDLPNGRKRVENLRAGDMVLTRDMGEMQVRWIGSTTVKVRSKANAPVRIKAGTLGSKRDIVVSPNHRVLVQNYSAELLFGDNEVLVKAKDLINFDTITWADDLDEVTYFHILLDTHQMLISDGLVSESYQPGAMTLQGFDAASRADIASAVPRLQGNLEDYGPSVRMSVKSAEVAPLLKLMCA